MLFSPQSFGASDPDAAHALAIGQTPRSTFGYFFPDVAADERQELEDAHMALAGSMLDPELEHGGADPTHDGTLASVYTFLGYLIDHDMASPLPTDPLGEDGRPMLALRGPGLVPLDRDGIIQGLGNLHSGGLRLETLYGGTLSEAEQQALRDPNDRACLRVETTAQVSDPRNSTFPLLSQLVEAFARLHNKIAKELETEHPDAEERFAATRQNVMWLWQWLIMNDYLPHLCEPRALDRTMNDGAAFYSMFRQKQQAPAGALPVPLEYTFAVAGFHHSMIRATYGATNAPEARLEALLSTAKSHGQTGWPRLVASSQPTTDFAARRIDPGLAHPLGRLQPTGDQWPSSLPLRCLRIGYRLSLPTAQGALTAFNQFAAGRGQSQIAEVSAGDLCTGPTGHAILEGAFFNRCPLWFYILKEAELTTQGLYLGALGSTLLAETLVGLIINDVQSYWNASGHSQGSWHPRKIKVDGMSLTSFERFLHVAGLTRRPGPRSLVINNRRQGITGA